MVDQIPVFLSNAAELADITAQIVRSTPVAIPNGDVAFQAAELKDSDENTFTCQRRL